MRLEDGVVSYGPSGELAQIALSDIRVIGELTLAADLCREDYFLVLVVGTRRWLWIPMGATGLQGVVDDLAAELGTSFEFRLMSEIELASRVLWPEPLIGQRVFDHEPIPTTGLRRIVEKLFGTEQVELVLTRRVQAALDGTE